MAPSGVTVDTAGRLVLAERILGGQGHSAQSVRDSTLIAAVGFIGLLVILAVAILVKL